MIQLYHTNWGQVSSTVQVNSGYYLKWDKQNFIILLDDVNFATTNSDVLFDKGLLKYQ